MKLEEAITYAIMSDGHGKTTDQIASAINRNGWQCLQGRQATKVSRQDLRNVIEYGI